MISELNCIIQSLQQTNGTNTNRAIQFEQTPF
jgi:hypothetical protein